MEVLVTLKHLKVADRPGDVEKCLRKNGVRFLHRLDVIFTNFDALRMPPQVQPMAKYQRQLK